MVSPSQSYFQSKSLMFSNMP